METSVNKALSDTHEATNLASPLENHNTYLTDHALQEAVKREGGDWATDSLIAFGAESGSAPRILLGVQANENRPVLHTHDPYGRRIDQVDFHPAYHQLWEVYRKQGIHSSPWINPKPGAHVARTAKAYLQCLVEPGHGCPGTMTFAAVPVIKMEPSIAKTWLPLITNEHYDPRNLPIEQKKGVTMGMAVTEKQGGSDVQSNSTQAYPIGPRGSGEMYELVGHKYFVSGPMGDGSLLLAQTPEGLSCFLVPRWRPDGTKNPMQIQQLKNKMGNISNASAETELRGAMGWLIGEEGQGLKVILKAIALTRFDCMLGSAAGMRQAVAQATHYCQQRSAFGKNLIQQPLMQNVLADLALESDAALAFTMRMARALDNAQQYEQEALLARIGTAVGKYWVCKRTPGHAYEAMECHGGNGYMEESPMPRLYREAPVNAIWEGSGNVQALDILRAISRTKGSMEAFINEVTKPKGANSIFDGFVNTLKQDLNNTQDMEYRARQIAEKMGLALQASILLQSDNQLIADAFCLSRLNNNGYSLYGTLPKGIDCQAIVQRACPTTC